MLLIMYNININLLSIYLLIRTANGLFTYLARGVSSFVASWAILWNSYHVSSADSLVTFVGLVYLMHPVLTPSSPTDTTQPGSQVADRSAGVTACSARARFPSGDIRSGRTYYVYMHPASDTQIPTNT